MKSHSPACRVVSEHRENNFRKPCGATLKATGDSFSNEGVSDRFCPKVGMEQQQQSPFRDDTLKGKASASAPASVTGLMASDQFGTAAERNS